MDEQRKKYQQAYNARKFIITCECGAVYTYGRKQAHLRSKLHGAKLQEAEYKSRNIRVT
jgi:hypothetical protein